MFYDEAGHRVATQYLLSVLERRTCRRRSCCTIASTTRGCRAIRRKGSRPASSFSPAGSGTCGRSATAWRWRIRARRSIAARLGRLADGRRQRRGRATVASAKSCNVKILIDDNNVTISGHPQRVHGRLRPHAHARRLRAADRNRAGRRHRRRCTPGCAARSATTTRTALVIKRKMAPGIEGAEGHPHAHEVLKAEVAIKYLEQARPTRKARSRCSRPPSRTRARCTYKGSSGVGKNRDDFGKIINEILDGMSESIASRACASSTTT